MLNNSSKYQIIIKEAVASDDYILVSKYYQPVIGPVATLIYINFLNEVYNSNQSKEISITKLQVYINTSIDKIYYALKILVKANLIEMYKSNIEEKFIFELKKPYNKQEFFEDSSLSGLLSKQVGENIYNEILCDNSANGVDLDNYYKLDTSKPVEKKENKNPYYLYFKDLKLTNSEEEILELVKVSELNKLSKIEIETILPICKTDSVINISKFVKSISVIRDEPKEVEVPEVVTTKDDALVVFDKYNSELFLSKLSNGRELTNSEKNLIMSLRTNYKLVDPVINVLIDYVLLINDKNLNKNFVEAIAANWSRKGFTTSTEAMEFVKNYNKKKNEPTNELQGNIVPDWLNNEVVKEPVKHAPVAEPVKIDPINEIVDLKPIQLEEVKVEQIKETPKTIQPVKEEVIVDSSEEPFDIFSNFEGDE